MYIKAVQILWISLEGCSSGEIYYRIICSLQDCASTENWSVIFDATYFVFFNWSFVTLCSNSERMQNQKNVANCLNNHHHPVLDTTWRPQNSGITHSRDWPVVHFWKVKSVFESSSPSARPVPISSFCGMKWLGIFLHPLDGIDASPSQGYPQRLTRRYPFAQLGGARPREKESSKVSCPRTKHNTSITTNEAMRNRPATIFWQYVNSEMLKLNHLSMNKLPKLVKTKNFSCQE